MPLVNWQVIAASNHPQAADYIGTGQPYFIADVVDDIEAVIRQQSINKSWQSFLGLTSTNWTGALAFTFISVNSFSVQGDQTANYRVGAVVQAQVSAGAVYGVIIAATFAGGITTVTLQMRGAGALDSSLTDALLGAIVPDAQGVLPDSVLTQNVNPLFCVAATSDAHAYTGTLLPPILAYYRGLIVYVKIPQTNQASPTLALNGLAATPIDKPSGSGLVNVQAGDLVQNQYYQLIYDDTTPAWQLLSPWSSI